MGMSAALGPCRGETLMHATARDRLMKKVDTFPAAPGIYLMKDRRSEVIYVGKARNLRARVRSYFLPAARDERLISLRLDQVADGEEGGGDHHGPAHLGAEDLDPALED